MQNDILKILSVSSGLRKLGRIESVSESEKDNIVEKLTTLKLGFLSHPSDTVVGDYHILFSNHQDILIQAAFSQSLGSKGLEDGVLGKLYGYPECCTQKFLNMQHEIANDRLEIESCLENSTKNIYPFYMNNTVGYKLFFHIPCSLDCKKTELIARNHLVLLQKHFPKKDFVEYVQQLYGAFYLGERKVEFT